MEYPNSCAKGALANMCSAVARLSILLTIPPLAVKPPNNLLPHIDWDNYIYFHNWLKKNRVCLTAGQISKQRVVAASKRKVLKSHYNRPLQGRLDIDCFIAKFNT